MAVAGERGLEPVVAGLEDPRLILAADVEGVDGLTCFGIGLLIAEQESEIAVPHRLLVEVVMAGVGVRTVLAQVGQGLGTLVLVVLDRVAVGEDHAPVDQ